MTPVQLGSILLPFLAALGIWLFMRGRSKAGLCLVTAAVVSLSSVFAVSAFLSMPPPAFCFSWLASAGDMCLSFQKAPLLLVLFNSLFLLIFLGLQFRAGSEFGAKDAVLILFSFASLQVALLSENFLLRYAALEMVGLALVAAALFLLPIPNQRWRNASLSFLNLKIGDLALLIAIFIMSSGTRSFEISANLSQAVSLPSSSLSSITLALLVAIWVKMAVWPLDGWSDMNSSLPAVARFWLLRASLPLLGAYLLYRSLPLIQSLPTLKVWLPLLCLVAWLAALRGMRSPPRLVQSQFHFSSLCLLWISPFVPLSDFYFLLVAWIVARFPLALVEWALERKEGFRISWLSVLTIISVQWVNLTVLWFFMRIFLAQGVDLWIQILIASVWWAQGLNSVISHWNQYQISSLKPKKSAWVSLSWAAASAMLGIWLLARFVNVLLNASSLWLKGSSFSLWLPSSGWFGVPSHFPVFWFSMLPGFALWAAAAFLAYFFQRFRHQWDRFKDPSRLFTSGLKEQSRDPLDLYGMVVDAFIRGARLVYRYVEGDGAESFARGLGRIFKVAFSSIENFNSAVLWTRLLDFIRKRTRDLQLMHAGFLRQNLMLLLVFIFLVMVILWLNTEGFVF
jgi:hypothetical protein